ncbi:MAG: glycoside hydrolase family 15 protein [Verrucomicrobiaceae bacterium]|nr:glycoside hydrolase family 15 protein [Verrucomicrobiaceae bacterium]
MKIEDYGFLSDTECAALVGKDGSIDWLCMPRFDSPACFSKLLGKEENGFWKIAPSGPHRFVGRQYRDGSLVLETNFETDDGAVRVIDCMPPRDAHPDVVRMVEGVRGRVAMELKLVIRFDYGQAVPWVRRCDGGVRAVAGPDALTLCTEVETLGENLATVARFTVEEGQRIGFILTWHPSHEPTPKTPGAEEQLACTEKFWKEWSDRCGCAGEWAAEQKRSLTVLKGLTYAPTGGVLAAATTSLPEKLGGVRNWDYRYCWLRDATFTLYALLNAGYTEEAGAWRDWLLRAVAGSADQMQIMYGVAGERRLNEFELPHLAGYENSRPVRIGNAASGQFQLDVYGELMDAMHQARRKGLDANSDSWSLEKHLLDYVMRHWNEEDEGIWEVRGSRRHFTHSKIMAWVAVDRAVKAVENFGLEGDAKKWRLVRDQIHREVCARGFNAGQGAFTQYFGSDKLDASVLMIPLVGFLPASDPRVRGTIETIARELVSDGFVMRYRPGECTSVDGLPPGEGAFLPCSFWLADCLHLIGRCDDARELFLRLLGVRNDLGLISEEYDPKEKRLLGNFPQAFSHVGLINTARNLCPGGGPAAHRSA